MGPTEMLNFEFWCLRLLSKNAVLCISRILKKKMRVVNFKYFFSNRLLLSKILKKHSPLSLGFLDMQGEGEPSVSQIKTYDMQPIILNFKCYVCEYKKPKYVDACHCMISCINPELVTDIA
ncbi:unnamed protein product [Meganyctiphanes norvegica]|uniref:Uncharacterized protein n=1 Tax=Meganyctiphanes norvegica TaxID=48144 RepID=A0AAV2RHA9_MEGNR